MFRERRSRAEWSRRALGFQIAAAMSYEGQSGAKTVFTP